METLRFEYPTTKVDAMRGHAGVVSSGDLEVLIEPSGDKFARFVVRTSVEGYGPTWHAVLARFVEKFGASMNVEINDGGATPGMVMFRLEQAWENGGDVTDA
jgi:malonate decarboxylase delta subunit